MIKHQFASIMWTQDHDLLPNPIIMFIFKLVSGEHSENIDIHTSTHGKKMFKFTGLGLKYLII